jgi:hypothetical protein
MPQFYEAPSLIELSHFWTGGYNPMFDELFQGFMKARTEYYEKTKRKIGGLKIHVPIPIRDVDGEYALAALVHGLWSMYLGSPDKILQVSNEGVKYIRIEESEVLPDWKGPVFSGEFEKNEERLLEISVDVFDLYLLNTKNELVEEYAQKFLSITPPEFISLYGKLNQHFLDWLMSKNPRD